MSAPSMPESERSTLVYVRSPRGPVPERWAHDTPAGAKAGKVIIASRELTEAEAVLPLSELQHRYPLPS